MITVAVQKGSYVYVYGENNRSLFSQYGQLYGFTGSSVSVKKNKYVYTYDERGHQISCQYCG